MDKTFLLESAGELKQVGAQAAADYSEKSAQCLNLINSRMLARPDIETLIGKNNLTMMYDNHANHVRFMESVFQHFIPEVLVETVIWVFRAYRRHGFSSNYWASQLNAWIEILKTELPGEAFHEIYPYYAWMQTNIPLFVILADQHTDEPDPWHN